MRPSIPPDSSSPPSSSSTGGTGRGTRVSCSPTPRSSVHHHAANAPPPPPTSPSRRGVLLGSSLALASAAVAPWLPSVLSVPPTSLADPSFIDLFSGQGPCEPLKLPRVEHICTSAFPGCLGNQCIVRCDIIVPKGAERQGIQAPYPLAIITPGFLVPSSFYESYARRLASWGYAVVLYDKLEGINSVLDDVTSAQFVTELIDWVGTENRLLSRYVDSDRVFLVGHSRGGKISTLAAASDPRVQALFLIDPVDNTKYAPLGEGYPSACDALATSTQRRGGKVLPVGIVGAGIGSDCAPPDSNYKKYYASAQSSWLLVVRDTGHFDYLDETTSLFTSICASGPKEPAVVREAAQTAMVAFAQLYCPPRGEGDAADSAPADDTTPSSPPAPSIPGAAPGGGSALAQLVADAAPPRLISAWPKELEPRQVVKLATLSIVQQLKLETTEVLWGTGSATQQPGGGAKAQKRKERAPLESLFKGLDLGLGRKGAPQLGGAAAAIPVGSSASAAEDVGLAQSSSTSLVGLPT